MNNSKCLTVRLGFAVCAALMGALTGCVGYVDQPRALGGYNQAPPPPREEVYVPPPSVQVEASDGSVGVSIQTESDFYEPLTPYGRWEVVGSYGRCWIPGRVEADWRPYCQGYWQRTDAGWYWASDEPWAWATYHYGRWDLSPEYGWYWVPQTQWAPAWVSWHRGGGYVGWAPLYPSARFAGGGSLEVDVSVISPRAYVFVEERHFLEPVRPSTVVVNNTTIINQTVNITNIKVVNNTVINEGPKTQIVEQASGRKVQEVPFRELRRKQEAPVVARQPITAPAVENKAKNIQTPVRSEAQPRAVRAAAAPRAVHSEQPGVRADPPAAFTPTGRVRESEKPKSVTSQARPGTETPQPAAIRAPAAPHTDKRFEKQQQPAKPSATKIHPPARETPAANERHDTNTVDKIHGNKAKE